MTESIEIMRDGFEKTHRGHGRAKHRFTKPDGWHSDPHDHRGDIAVRVRHFGGGYLDEVFDLDGTSRVFERKPGDLFFIPATRIHRIVELLGDEVITDVLYAPHSQEWRFWRWIDGTAQARFPNEEWPK